MLIRSLVVVLAVFSLVGCSSTRLTEYTGAKITSYGDAEVQHLAAENEALQHSVQRQAIELTAQQKKIESMRGSSGGSSISGVSSGSRLPVTPASSYPSPRVKSATPLAVTPVSSAAPVYSAAAPVYSAASPAQAASPVSGNRGFSIAPDGSFAVYDFDLSVRGRVSSHRPDEMSTLIESFDGGGNSVSTSTASTPSRRSTEADDSRARREEAERIADGILDRSKKE